MHVISFWRLRCACDKKEKKRKEEKRREKNRKEEKRREKKKKKAWQQGEHKFSNTDAQCTWGRARFMFFSLTAASPSCFDGHEATQLWHKNAPDRRRHTLCRHLMYFFNTWSNLFLLCTWKIFLSDAAWARFFVEHKTIQFLSERCSSARDWTKKKWVRSRSRANPRACYASSCRAQRTVTIKIKM